MSHPEKLRLHTLLGTHPNTKALKSGAVASDLVAFDFADIPVANRGFKPMVRQHVFDFGELAIGTFLQARVAGAPYRLIPATVVGRGQLHTIAYLPERGPLAPGDLAGKRVGVRAYSQTTGIWLRGMLEELYGVAPETIDWVTFEDAHVAGYQDPPFVRRAAEGEDLVRMLLDGALDAAIVGDKFPDPRLAPLVPDPEAANDRWAASHGGVPINHMLVLREEIAATRPDVVRELYRMIRESTAAGGLPTDDATAALRFGIEPNRRSLELIIDYAFRQKLIPERVGVDSLFDDTARSLA
ncbi:phosphate ABC transporter substrate-binding protein [Rhodoplanes sp. SY1]|uniref:phosphate ABC transporter substrate-binding protein n=1 Tax=Rhodoplanes sp. SY1 TaxID=3166646 RepID=UPI0038B55C12